MKRHIVIAFVYAIVAMLCGVFYREFTKACGFTDPTALGKAHTHLFMLGMVMFLLFALFDGKFRLRDQKLYLPFLIVYNAGVAIASVMMLVRGVFETTGTALSAGADGAISGIAGLGHILTAVGIVFFFVMLLIAVRAGKNAEPEEPQQSDKE